MKRNFQQEIATPEDCKSYSRQRLCLSVLINTAIVLCFLIIITNIAVFFANMNYNGIANMFNITKEKDILNLRSSLIYGSAFFILTIAVVLIIYLNKKTFVTVGAISAWIAGTTIIAIISQITRIWIIATFGILGICMTILFGWLYKHRKLKTKAISTRTITVLAMFIALSIVFKMISNTISAILVVPQLKLSINYIIWVISGLALGPLGGFIVGGVSDLVGQIIVPTGGAPLPLLTLSNALYAVFPAIFYQYVKFPSKSGRSYEALRVIIGMIISNLVCSFGISSLVLWNLYAPDTNFFVYLLVQRSPQLISIVLNAIVIVLLLKPLKKVKIISPHSLYFDNFKTKSKSEYD